VPTEVKDDGHIYRSNVRGRPTGCVGCAAPVAVSAAWFLYCWPWFPLPTSIDTGSEEI